MTDKTEMVLVSRDELQQLIGASVRCAFEEYRQEQAPQDTSEYYTIRQLAEKWGVAKMEEDAPVCFIGTGASMNEAIDNGLGRASSVLDLPLPEVKNRATVAGAIEIGRAPGVVMVTFRCPVDRLERVGLMPFVRQQYTL